MDPEQITRPILWNVGPFTQGAMYVLCVVATAIAGHRIWQRWRVWQRGRIAKPTPCSEPLGKRELADGQHGFVAGAARLWRHVFLQQRIARILPAWLSHLALFYGFIVLFIGTVLVAIEHYGLAHFFYGRFYLIASFALDLAGVAFILALFVAAARRVGLTRVRPSNRPIDALLLALLGVIGLTGFVVEALRIVALDPSFETVSFVGWGMAKGFRATGLSADGAIWPHFALWWAHMVLVFVFLALVPYTKLLHFVVAPFHIARTPEPRSGRLPPVSLEEVEETGRVGVGTIADLTRGALLSFDACTHCRRCESACPAWQTGKPLSPMRVVLDLAAAGNHEGSLHGDVISAETLWSCTTCGACVRQCPVLIDQMGTIVEMRRHLVGEGQVLGSSQAALRSIAATGNPWGLPRAERAAWAQGLDVPTLAEEPDPEVIFWVGCAGSYDRRNQQVSRAMVEVLRAAGVRMAILGRDERCTGDPARRLGDDFTFMEAAQENVATLDATGCKQIVTACAHCFNTLRNEYPDYGGHYQVRHHTQYIEELVASGRLKLPAADANVNAAPITFHDPCYLSRHNDGSAAPRAVLDGLSGPNLPIVEPDNCGPAALCCGAGGGRMWMEEAIDQRVNFRRFAELKATGAKTVAVGCPYCMTMLDDASKNDEAAGIVVKDIAELVAERLASAAPTTASEPA